MDEPSRGARDIPAKAINPSRRSPADEPRDGLWVRSRGKVPLDAAEKPLVARERL
jgi:hypothetical protein